MGRPSFKIKLESINIMQNMGEKVSNSANMIVNSRL